MDEKEHDLDLTQEVYRQLAADYLVDHGDAEAHADTLMLTGARRERVVALIKALRNRRSEALNLYRPLPHLAGMHASKVIERVVRGSNRGGKTLCAAVECARIVTNQDPFRKITHPSAKNGRCVIVGKDGRHNAEVLYRKLFRFGAFQIIESVPGNGRWVAFNPLNPEHAARKSEAKDAPPLIPPRFIKDIAWENKKESQPRLVVLKNGWEMTFFTSLGKPPNGIDVNYAWFDEEIVDLDWYSEIAARLIDRSGLFLWSATAQYGGMQFWEMCERADREVADGVPEEDRSVMQWMAHINDNTHFTQAQRDHFFAKLTAEQRRIRIDGEFAFTERKVYPEFSEHVHGVPYFDIPALWTRYMIVDPGRQVCAVLFVAVPNPSHVLHGQVFAYDELYIKGCSAAKFGEMVGHKVGSQNFEEFIIDNHGGRITDTGGGQTIEVQYSEELRKRGIRSNSTGHGFRWGSSDIAGGLEAVRSWLLVRGDGTTKFHYFKDKLVWLPWEAKRYAYKKVKDTTTDKPLDKDSHLMDTLRYIAMRDPKWKRPPRRVKTARGLLKRLAEKKQKNRKHYGINLGPAR